MNVDRTVDRLSARVAGYGRPQAVVALSGGVDSSVVVAVAARALGPDRVLAVTALSPSYPTGELDDARAVAAALAVPHRTIDTGEVEREAYARNDDLRCYHCKMELYTALSRIASGHGGADAVVLAGANGDDAEDLRPGLLAARQRGIRNPLLELGVRKDEVRAMARRFGLPVAEKPAMACLSSRVAFGVRVTPDLLGRIDRGEQAVRALGFQTVRIRHFGERAVIEVDPRDVERLGSHPALAGLMDRLRGMGWSSVAIDGHGYRQGAMNATLSDPARIVALTLEGLPGQAIED